MKSGEIPFRLSAALVWPTAYLFCAGAVIYWILLGQSAKQGNGDAFLPATIVALTSIGAFVKRYLICRNLWKATMEAYADREIAKERFSNKRVRTMT